MIRQHHQDIGQENQDRSQWSVPELGRKPLPQAAKAAKRNAPAKYPPSMARDLETPRRSSIRPMTGEKRLPDQMGSHA